MSKRYQMNKTKHLSEGEQLHLEKVLDDYKHKDLRDCTLIRLALETGARASELLNIRREHIDFEHNTILIIGLKGSNDREIPIKPSTMSDVKELLSQNDSGQLFNISYKRFFQIWKEYRPHPDKGIHSLRHSFAINLFKKTKDLRLVQLALGHRNISNTMIYADYVYSREEMRKIIA